MTSTVNSVSANNLVFPDFNDIKVSTKTYIAMTNLILDLKKLYHFLPVTGYKPVEKRRGRKRKTDTTDDSQNIEPGSIITLKFEDQIRGVDLKKKKKKADDENSRKQWFRNSFTVVIVITQTKFINFKVCKNGVFQITGCKTREHAEMCVKYIWEYIKDATELYKFSRSSSLITLFVPAMRNIDFSLGFLVDREKLAEYTTHQTDFPSLLETTFGYTGVNIRIPLDDDITKMRIKKLIHKGGEWKEINTTYQEYLDLLPPREQQKKLSKDRHNTFLVFQSGNVIMSGITSQFMKETYDNFLDMIRRAYNDIEERLDKPDSIIDIDDISNCSDFERENTEYNTETNDDYNSTMILSQMLGRSVQMAAM